MSDDDKLLPFPAKPDDQPQPEPKAVMSSADGIRISVPNAGAIDWDEMAHELAEARRQAERLRSPRLEPDVELKAIVAALMEAFADVREKLDGFDRSKKLRRSYESFRCQLEAAGFTVRFETRAARAAAHRRLGELAEERGDMPAALMHYELAVRSRKDVGCRRRAVRIRTYLEKCAARERKVPER